MKNVSISVICVIFVLFASCATGESGIADQAGAPTQSSGNQDGTILPTTQTGELGIADQTGASTQSRSSHGDGTPPTTLTGWDWRLAELRNAAGTVTINRTPPAGFEAADLSGWFAISFMDGQISGTGAPNRYSGPYTAGANQAISIGNFVSTKMASFVELAELKEHEYFGYLSRVTRWEIRGGRLELYSTDENKAERVLVFDPS